MRADRPAYTAAALSCVPTDPLYAAVDYVTAVPGTAAGMQGLKQAVVDPTTQNMIIAVSIEC